MMPEKYLVLDIEGYRAYVRKDRLNELRRIDGIVFDCDGVLIDIKDSYNKAISKAVALILEALTGCSFPERLISDEVIFLFRRTGGFNNDWDSVYGIIMFILSNLPQKTREKLKREMEIAVWQHDPFKRLSLLRDTVDRNLDLDGFDSGFLEGLMGRLKGFTELLDAAGIVSVDRNLTAGPEASEAFVDYYRVSKRFLNYPGGVAESIVARVFEEFFCGPEIFRKMYNDEPEFYKGSGMIENEKLIIKPETLERLESIMGKANLGIASGSRLEPARHTLGEILGRFSPEALIFLETIEKAEHGLVEEEGLNVNLKKPHPFCLLKAAEAFGSSGSVLYVGDSMEDALLAKEARKTGGHFLFAGVYRYSGLDELVLSGFLKTECDMVIPSVNELPYVLEKSRSEKK